MLKLSIKNSVRRHGALILCIIILTACAVFACDIAVFSFNSAQQNRMKMSNATDYQVVMDEPMSGGVSDKVNKILSELSDTPETVYAVVYGETEIRAFFCGSDVYSAGRPPKTADEVLIGNRTKSLGYDVGDKVEIGGKEFTVCGVRPMRQYDEILPQAIDVDSELSELHFQWDRVLSGRKSARFTAELKKVFADKEIIVPEDANLLDGILFELRTSAWIAGIASCNLIFIFCYLLRSKGSVYSVLYIFGAKKRYVFRVAVSELLIYAVTGGAVGNLLFMLLLYPKQTDAEDFILQGLSVSFIFSIVICLAVALPVIGVNISKQLLREEDNYV